ncbi:hypothetical protein D030_1803A, partial [Vibrio parahaemolyticus AQ3810]
MLPCHRA